MKITVLGCGTSTGVPVPGCDCDVCLSEDPKNTRLRASILIQTDSGKNIIIDTSPDFRQQVLRAKVKRVDAVLFTHAHADHIMGLDDLRSFNFFQGAIPCYATKVSWDSLSNIFSYIFNPDPDYKGGGVPKIERHYFKNFDVLTILDQKIETFALKHGNMEVSGFRLGNFAYATDCNFIPEKSLGILKGVKALIIDGLRYQSHPTHFTISEAIDITKDLGVERVIFTHYTHSIEYNEANSKLPNGYELALDQMEILL